MRNFRKFPHAIILISLIPFIFLSGSFKIVTTTKTGIFTYMVNDKVHMMENVKATMRTTTGGRKQLSLSNDRFIKFFFIDPSVRQFDLSTAESKQAIIRYNEPGTNSIYYPKNGFVHIKNLNDSTKILSAEFEMEMVMPGKDKVIRITKGQIIDVPILFVR